MMHELRQALVQISLVSEQLPSRRLSHTLHVLADDEVQQIPTHPLVQRTLPAIRNPREAQPHPVVSAHPRARQIWS